ncbi:MAG TPA: hypothetical protein VED37_02720 [Ktedonobacteraceae bacterium]|nr:hypothetical protein [Ktedonobacteraceae bacterium]
MASRQSWEHINIRIIASIAICVTIALLNIAFPKHVTARERTGEPTFQVKAGFESHYRDGAWVPVLITLHNDGPDFDGTLSLITPTPQFQPGGNQPIQSDYQASISLANGAQKQVTMYLPIYFDAQNVTVKLLDNSGHTVGTQSAPLLPLTSDDICIGILSDQNSGFSSLSTLPLPNQGGSIVLEFLNANTLPSLEAALKNFNIIVLDNFTTANLSAAQLNALQNWTEQGGSLILIGGPDWHRSLGTLPANLVPFQISGSSTIPPGTMLLPPGGSITPTANSHTPSVSLNTPVPISMATLKPLENSNTSQVILASQTAPLIIQTQQEQGTIIYLAFDPTLEPILGWQGAGALWNSLVLRSMGDQILHHYGISSGFSSATQQSEPVLANRMSGFIQSLLPPSIPPPWHLLGVLFLCYILLLGLGRFLLVKRLKGRYWSWRIILISIVIFSLLSYGLAYIEKGSSILSDSISIAQFNQNGTSVHISTYMGVFVPNEGNYQVHFPGNTLVQPSPDNLSTPAGPFSGAHTTVEELQSSTSVNLQDVNIWTLHTILAEQDRQVHKGLVSQLTLQNGYLVGTVTNTFSYALNDAFLLTPNDAFKLGRLSAGETKHVQIQLSSVPLPPGSTLADLISVNTNSPNYDALPAQPQNTWQRHLAILYALDDEGLYNFSPACTSLCSSSVNPLASLLSGSNTASFNNVSTSGNYVGITATPGWEFTEDRETDPLLVPGLPVTFIGWAENPPDLTTNVTVGNTNPAGFHETLVQSPLNVNLTGPLNLPPNFIQGHLIDVTSNSAQIRFPGIYSLSTGSMTFEYLIPPLSKAYVKGLIISEPPNINALPLIGQVSELNSSLFRLYNWHTNSWDSIPLNQNSFATTNLGAYISANGRVLLQFMNNGNQLGLLDFGRPIINLQGVIPGQ